MIGFKCGVALFLASTQLPKLFGFHGAHGDFWENSGVLPAAPGRDQSRRRSLVGGAALAVLVLGKIFLQNKPVALFVVVGGIVASSAARPRRARREAARRGAAGPAGARAAGDSAGRT